MSGHSKFKNIMHRKGAQDAKRAKMFTKIGRELVVAARNGDDPVFNPALRAAVALAKAANMPKDRIDRAIRRGAGVSSFPFSSSHSSSFAFPVFFPLRFP